MREDAPQSDTHLRILPECGGQSARTPGRYAQVRRSSWPRSACRVRHTIRMRNSTFIRRLACRECLAVLVRSGKCAGTACGTGAFTSVPPDADGVLRSSVFPGPAARTPRRCWPATWRGAGAADPGIEFAGTRRIRQPVGEAAGREPHAAHVGLLPRRPQTIGDRLGRRPRILPAGTAPPCRPRRAACKRPRRPQLVLRRRGCVPRRQPRRLRGGRPSAAESEVVRPIQAGRQARSSAVLPQHVAQRLHDLLAEIQRFPARAQPAAR